MYQYIYDVSHCFSHICTRERRNTELHVMMYGMMFPKGYEITFNGYNKEDLKKVVQFLNNHDIKSVKIIV